MQSLSCETYFSDDIDSWWGYYRQLPEESQAVYHRPDYFLFQENIGFGKAILQVFRHKDFFIYYPGLLRPLPDDIEGYDIDSGWYYGGPITNWLSPLPLEKSWLNEIDKARKELNVIAEFIRFDPNLGNKVLLETHCPVEYNRETVVVNLYPEWSMIWRNFSPQNRRNLKKAIDNQLTVKKYDSPDSWKAFADIYIEEMNRKNAPGHLRFNMEFFGALQRLTCIELFLIMKGNMVIGGFVAAAGKYIAHHFLSATRYAFWDIRPNNYLFTEVIRYYHQTGRKCFDFQGGRDGVFRFKCNFSDQRRSFYVGKKIFHPDKYAQLSDGKKTSFFPAYRDTQ